MNENKTGYSCLIICLAIAGLLGILVLALLMVVGEWRFLPAVMIGGLVGILAAFVLPWAVCSSAKSGPAGAGTAPTAGSASSSTSSASSANAGSASAAAAAPAAASTAAAAPAAAQAKPAKPAPVAEAPAAAASSSEPAVKPSAELKGEAELAERKGDWKYEGEAKADKAPAAKPAPAPAADVGQDYDGDGVIEGKNEGTRPEALDGPRGGKADDLKQIKGVGPKMEKLCNSLGFYHFDQIASWSPDEVAWVDANLEGFKGRVTRDTWVEQATVLAAGGTTEFSKKVKKGDVY